MKKLLIGLGAVFGAILVVVAAAIAYFSVTGNALDKESQAYVDSAVPAIALHWSQDELTRRASAEFTRAVKDDDLVKLLSVFRRDLGDLRKYEGSTGDAFISLTTQNGKVITANYVASAEFENASATIHVKLIKHGEGWQILGFHVNSRAFLDH